MEESDVRLRGGFVIPYSTGSARWCVKHGLFPESRIGNSTAILYLQDVFGHFSEKFILSLFYNRETRDNALRLWELIYASDIPYILAKIAEYDALIARWDKLNAEMQEIEQTLEMIA